jgi:hypothetical protein
MRELFHMASAEADAKCTSPRVAEGLSTRPSLHVTGVTAEIFMTVR